MSVASPTRMIGLAVVLNMPRVALTLLLLSILGCVEEPEEEEDPCGGGPCSGCWCDGVWVDIEGPPEDVDLVKEWLEGVNHVWECDLENGQSAFNCAVGYDSSEECDQLCWWDSRRLEKSLTALGADVRVYCDDDDCWDI